MEMTERDVMEYVDDSQTLREEEERFISLIKTVLRSLILLDMHG